MKSPSPSFTVQRCDSPHGQHAGVGPGVGENDLRIDVCTVDGVNDVIWEVFCGDYGRHYMETRYTSALQLYILKISSLLALMLAV